MNIVGIATLLLVFITIYFRVAKIKNEKNTIRITEEANKFIVNQAIQDNTPSISFGYKFQKSTQGTPFFCVTAVVSNGGEKNVTVNKLTLHGEYQDGGGKRVMGFGKQDFLGDTCTLDSKSPVISPSDKETPELTLHGGADVALRVKIYFKAEVRVGNSSPKAFESERWTEFLV
jgi:hypothetical protein